MASPGHTARAALTACLAVMCASAAAEPAADAATLEAAAQRGDVPALMTLAGMYERGENVDKDYLRSNALYCKAAARGDSDALLKLGSIYASGREVMPSEGVGALLIHKAAEMGNERAKELAPFMSRGVGSVLPACMTESVAEVAAETPAAAPAPTGRKEVAELVQQWAPHYSLDPDLVMALINAESKFDAAAQSHKNAQGLMQLIPATAARFGVKNVFDALDNLKGGLAYLRWLMAYFRGDVALVLAAYNAGESAVERYRGIPPYRETRDYVRQITSRYKKASHPYETERVTQGSAIRRTKVSH